MAKFIVTFIFLAVIVALENRAFTKAHPSYDISEINAQQHNQFNHRYHAQQQQQQKKHHRYSSHNKQHRSAHRTHQKRHSAQQQLPSEELMLQPQQQRNNSDLSMDKLKSMPRLWQHLQRENNMYGDEPLSESSDSDDKRSALVSEMSNEDAIMADAIMKLRNDLSEFIELEEEKKQLKQQLLLSTNDDGYDNDDDDADDGQDDNVDIDNVNEENLIDFNSNQINDFAKAMQLPPSHNVPKGCPKCESSRQVEHVTEEELTRLRIEYVKQQILGKLRLKERPNVAAVRLPRPLYEGATIEHSDVAAKEKELDDYYARTSKKFIFLQREYTECQRLDKPAMCFSFKIDDADADGFDVSTAVLWIFKHKNKRRSQSPMSHTIDNGNSGNNVTRLLEQQTIVVSEVQQQQNEQQYLPVVKTIAIQTLDVQDEWMKIDIVWPIKRWFGNHELSHLIHITCESCEIETMDEIISVDKDYRPFIMVDTQNRRRQPRTKRSINCTDGVTECCREKLYISFDEMGWGDWIIQPRGYDAYFCRGSCSTLASIAQSSSHHNTFVQKLRSSQQQRNNGKALELIPCCTAKQYSSLQLVFMDTNNTATQKTFPNMVIESCGCR